MKTQKQTSLLLQVNDAIFLQTVSFLSPKDITQLALVSREIRLQVGKTINQSLKKQQQLFMISKQYLEKPESVKILEFTKLFKQTKVFSNKEAYQQFIQLLNYKNSDFYKDFLSIVLNKNIKFDIQHIQKQKNGLKQIHADIYQKLQNFENQKNIPEYKVLNYQYLGHFQTKTIKLIDFVSKFLKSIVELQQINNINFLYKECIQNKQYAKMHNGIEKLSIKNQYKNRIFFLKFKKCYHHFINFNLNSIIFQFLTTKEIQVLQKVDKIFARQIPNIIQIIKNNINTRLLQINNEQKNPLIEEAYNLYLQGTKIQIRKQQIYEIQAYANPPAVMTNLFTVIFQFLDQQIFNSVRNTFLRLWMNDRNFQNFLLEYQIIEISQKQYYILDAYFGTIQGSQVERVSVFLYKLFLNLQFNYMIKKLDIKLIDFYQHINQEKKKVQLSAMLSEFNNFTI